MTYRGFPKQRKIMVAQTGTGLYLGGFKIATTGEIAHGRICLFKKGAQSGAEEFRLRAYATAELNDPLFASSWVGIDSVVGDAANWLGLVRFDFSRQNVQALTTYHFVFDTSAYTRDGDDYYLGVVADWPPSEGKNPPVSGTSRNYADLDLFIYVEKRL